MKWKHGGNVTCEFTKPARQRDRSKIGFMDIRSNYTLIDLPLGMPPDIFQLLQTVEIKQHALQIKRVNASRKRPWQRRKGTGQNRANEREANVADTPMRR
jgi:hypothetical protein